MKADKNVFPYRLQKGCGSATVYTGLEARDYIAAQALIGLSANPEFTEKGY